MPLPRAALLTLALGTVLFPAAGAAAELRIRLRDEAGRPITARLEIDGPDGRASLQPGPGSAQAIPSRPPGRPDAGSPYLRSFVTKASTVVINAARPGLYRIVAEHGLEYERVTHQVEIAAGHRQAAAVAVDLTLRPWIRMRERGWWSGDMHVHRAMEIVPALLAAEGVNLGVVFTMWNRQDLWSASGQPLPSDPVRKTGPYQWMTVANAEDERGGGAWMLHGLHSALGIDRVLNATERTTENWNPPGIEFVRQARKQKRSAGAMFPWFDLEKPIWWEAPVMMAIERPDSMGLLHNHYDQYAMYDNEAWGRKRNIARFPGPSGFSDYSLHLMYRYWNLGWLVTPTAGAASGVLPNPVGYNRVYVKLDGAFTVEKWYEGVRQGRRVMVSNGPLVFFEPKPDRGGRRLRGRLDVIARERLTRVELVADGQVIQTWAPAAKRFRVALNAGTAGYSWVAARAYEANDATVRLGHTGPWPLHSGLAKSRREDARYFREWVEELQRNPKTPPGSPAGALYEEAVRVYREMETR